jgi:hypothetical protein
MLFGDSMARSHDVTSENNYDSLQGYWVLKSLYDQGVNLDARQVVVDRWAGFTIETTGGNDLSAEIGGALTRHNPTDVVYIGGTNDVINASLDIAQMESDLDSQIAQIQAYSGVERIALVNVRSLVGNAASNTAGNRDRRDNDVNPVIASRSIPYVDAYSLLGSESPASYTYIGQTLNPGNDFHIAAAGNYLEGIEYLNALDSYSAGTPTLTTPYSIGTNNGPMFAVTFSGSSSAFEAANFLDNRAGWASLLKTNDVLVVTTSSGTKMYTVTVDKEARTIALSTGLVIA